MVISPYNNKIIDGGRQVKKYLKNGHIIVANHLCPITQDNVRKFIKENVKNNTLVEIEIPEKCRSIYIDAIHREVPFPLAKYLLTESYIKNQFSKLKKRKPEYHLQNGEIVFTYKSSDYEIMKITDYFTEQERMKCSVKNHSSPYTLFSRKSYLHKLLATQSKVSSSIIREQIWKLSKECTLFKNTLVYDVCKHFKAKSYLDISAGWGDRLIGALAAGIESYVGYDPNIQLKKGHSRIQEMFDKKKVSKIHYEPFEAASVPANSFDLVLSSPPYFDFEIYTNSKTQSFKTFNSFDQWLNGFLFVALQKAWLGLKVNGNMIIHIDDVRGYNITKPMIQFMQTKLNGASNVNHVYVGGHKGKLRKMFHIKKLVAN